MLVVDNPNLTPWKTLIQQTAEAQTSGEKYEPTKQDVSTAFGGKKTTASSKKTSSTSKTTTAATVSQESTPPLPTINLYDSPAYEEHTSVIGLPATRPGETTPLVDVPTTPAYIPRYSRSGGTATPSELSQVDHTRSSAGVLSSDMPDTQRERELQQAAAYRAGARAETRVQTEVSSPYQQVIQQEAQRIYTQEYTSLMDQRAQQLGISRDASGQYVVENPNQWRLLMVYSGIARGRAEEKAREYAVSRSRELGDTTESQTLRIYQEEYGREGMVVVKDPYTGQYQVMTREHYQREQLKGALEERYQQMPLPERTARIGMETFLNIGNVGMWYDLITKGPAAGYEHLKEYRTDIAQRRYEGDVFGALIVTPTFTNIALPLAISMGATWATPRIISRVAAQSARAGKIVEKTFQIGGRAMLGGYIGTEVGLTGVTAITQGPEQGMIRGLEAALRIASGYAGYRVMRGPSAPSRPIRKTELVYNKATGELSAERYIDIFGRKITYAYSKMTLQTRGLPGYGYRPSPQPKPYTPTGRWWMSETWQPQTGLPMPGIYTGTQPSVWVAPKPTTIFGWGGRGVPAVPTSFDFNLLTESQARFISNLYYKELGGRVPTTIDEAFTAYEKKWGKGIYRPAEPRRIERKPEWRPSYQLDVDPYSGVSKIKRGDDLFYQPSKQPTPSEGIYWKTGRELSKDVLPKPIPYGAYQTKYLIIDFTPYFKSLIIGRATGKPITPKTQPRIYTIKDIIKPEPTQGTPTGTGRQQTLLKTKTTTKQESITIQKQVQEQLQTQTQKQDYLSQMLQQKSVTQEQMLAQKTATRQIQSLYSITPQQQQSQQKKESIMVSGSLTADAQTEKQMITLLFGQTQTQQQGQQRAQLKADMDISKIYTQGKYVPPPFDTDLFFKPPPPPTPIRFSFEEQPPPPSKPGGGLLKDEGIQKLFGGQQGYIPQTLKTQYRNGQRIRGREWINVTPHAYSREDALAVASHKADNTAKRSIRVIPTDQKPRKRPGHINPWTDQMFEYRDKGHGVFVETNMFAIDSPGEIREISQRGWESRQKHTKSKKTSTKNQGFTLKNIPLKGFENKIRRRFIK